ncbi:MAG TPA: AmmeMemoRadiSam system protein A [Anaerolineae bacterium]|nr:AmmeMemoRadiSam system protein A [Anaerolineae bacterium]HQK13576.1 AmmeMemoRadiSam system protein A [Anaerolineae bacterium]
MTTALTPEERQYLLALARETITEATTGRKPAGERPPVPPRLKEPGAAFVTLHTRGGELRGCIGSLVAHRPLVEDVRENALAAAFRDPRFPPLSAAELKNIVIEISVLTQPQPLDFDGPDGLIRKLRPNVDGVIIEHGWNRATFLPQVWEQLPVPEEFLAHLCYKAGLPINAWRWPDLKVSIYQVEEFAEET